MKNLSRDFSIGLVSIVALIGFAALLMFFDELEIIGRKQYAITVNMNVAAGLRAGSPVELNGVTIGSVKSLRLQDDGTYPVRVTAMVDQQHVIPLPVQARVDRSLLAGTAILQLVGGAVEPIEPRRYLPTDGSGEIDVFERSLMEEIRAELDTRTQPLVDALEQFNRLSTTYLELGQNLNEFVRPLTDEDAFDTESATNLRITMARFHEVLDDVREALRLVNQWIGDEQLLADAKSAVANARQLTERAADTLDVYRNLAEKLGEDADQITMALLPVADEMTVTLEEIRSLVKEASEGRGTIARLVRSPDLYESLNDAAIRLEQALTEVRLFIEKIRAEGLPARLW